MRLIWDVREVENYRGVNGDGNDCSIKNWSIIGVAIC